MTAVTINCPGCGRPIRVPDGPAEAWAEKPYWCSGCGGTAPLAEDARQRDLAEPLHEVLADVLAGVPGYETSTEVLFSALVEIARRYIADSGCDAELTAQALLENLEVPA